MKVKHITFPSTGNYYTLGKGENLLYVLHGYRQLARFFIKKFEALQDRYTIVAPEGLHRFYLQGTSGRVGASWMTKEERETDIDNYLNFLNSLHQQISEGKNWESTSILGFSQGVATAFRWLANNAIQANTFMLCSGMIPPDVDLQENHHIFSAMEMVYFSGTNDPYKTEEAVKTFQERLNQLPYPIQKIEFEGKHEVHLPSILKFLETKV